MRMKVLFIIILGFTAFLIFQNTALAAITGTCVNCHTMHNSQNGTSMNFDNSPTPNDILLRSDCFGCHARGIAQNIDPITGAPQVSHTAATDLAGGNFTYILGNKGSGASDTKGHNVVDLGNNEDILTIPPTGREPPHPVTVDNTNLRCAGRYGCHGTRPMAVNSMFVEIRGAHHQNLNGKCDTANTVANSYRFLISVKGLEDSDWQATVSANDHNEYFGDTAPMSFQCTNCHTGMGAGPIEPANQTISGFCGTCHSYFHALEGIGGNISSPFTRHPTDVILPSNGEYSAYTTYSVEAPVARTTVPDFPSSVVNPGTDVVMCLSCHASHATDYPDILRWDYSDMIAGDTTKSGGCFTCHTQKNKTP